MSAGAITLAGFLALASTCGDGIAPKTLADITATESGFNALAINVNCPGGGINCPGAGTVRGITSKAQAIAKARDLLAAGKNFDAGVAQINTMNWQWLGLTAETAFDACANIGAQAKLLRSYSRYNTGSPDRGFRNGYVGKVVASGRRNREALADVAAPPDDCPGKPPSWDAWATAAHAARCRETITAKME